MEQRRIREEEIRRQQWEIEQKRIEEIRIQREITEHERQRRLEIEREEREKYILEKLRQEQEVIEIQRRQKLIQEQREREQYERQQQLIKHQNVKYIDNVSSYTTRITEEKHKSTELYEEHRIETSNNNNNNGVEKLINIQIAPYEHKKFEEKTSHKSNVVDHHVSTNNGHKHVLIVNSYKPESDSRVSRSQSPPAIRSPAKTSSTIEHSDLITKSGTESVSNKYAIKHKANRYVSGAIGILETSLNGEYIILENLSSNKNVNLKSWYIHRYVPDQNINVIFKFTNDTWLNSGEKLKILARNNSTKSNHGRSTSMHEGLNKSNNNSSIFKSNSNEKNIIASNIDNWGTYSKFSVTKLINPEGVDKAVLTQSLVRLATSTNNVNVISPKEIKEISEQQTASVSSDYYQTKNNVVNNKNSANYEVVNSKNNSNNNQGGNYVTTIRNVFPSSEAISTTTTTTTKKSSSSTMHHQQTMQSSSNAPNEAIYITRQF